MNHLEEFITEKRNLKDYKKYIDMLKNKYHDVNKNYIVNLALYKDNNIINLEIIFLHRIRDSFIDTIKEEMGNNIKYTIVSKNGSELILHIENVPNEYVDNIELEYSAKKYNL